MKEFGRKIKFIVRSFIDIIIIVLGQILSLIFVLMGAMIDIFRYVVLDRKDDAKYLKKLGFFIGNLIDKTR